MNVRRARDEDQSRIREIVDTLWSGDEMWRPDRATNYLASGPAAVLVAGDEEVIIRVGSFVLPGSLTLVFLISM